MRHLLAPVFLLSVWATSATALAAEPPTVPPTGPTVARTTEPTSEERTEAPPADGDPAEATELAKWDPFHFELALFPFLTEQQIEGPNRDDKLTQDKGLSTAFSFGYAPLEWIEPALWVQFDAGSVRRAVYTLSDPATGTAEEAQLAEGSFWALWVALMLRGRLGPGFVELGYAPLILRHDSLRSDLANTKGETDGVFQGSRSVAWILGGGLSVPVADNFDLTARLQFRIRYLVSRGGEPLANGEETGQMLLWPFIGAHYHF